MAGRTAKQAGMEPLAAFRAEIEAESRLHGLSVMGVTQGKVLIGMTPEGWQVFTQSSEFIDGSPDPLDRWSMRALPEIAEKTGAREVLYPFGGPPYQPFIRWAFESGETFQSPVGMLVHHRAGFWISFRGALVFDRPGASETPPSPCDPCEKPCETACPVGALAPGRDYDVARCKAHVTSLEGRECLMGGCLVRRACPVSQKFGRDPQQSEFHMKSFVGT